MADGVDGICKRQESLPGTVGESGKNRRDKIKENIVEIVQPNSSLGLTEYDDKMISTWNFGFLYGCQPVWKGR